MQIKEAGSKYVCIIHRMSSGQESIVSCCSELTAASEGSQVKRSRNYEEEIFYRNCRAAYLAIFKSSLENIKSKEQLCLGKCFCLKCIDFIKTSCFSQYSW